MKGNRLFKNFLLIITAMIWGTAFVAQIVGMEEIGPFTFSAVRYTLGTAVLLPVVLCIDFFSRRGTLFKERARDIAHEWHGAMPGGLICGLVLFSGTMLQQVGLLYTTAGKSGFITTFYMMIVPIYRSFFGKPPAAKTWGVITFSVFGMYLLTIKPGSFSVGRGELLTLAGAFVWAGHIICCEYFTREWDPPKLSCIQFVVVAILSTVCMFALETPHVDAIMRAWMPIAYAGVLSTAVAYTFQMLAQKDNDPVIASLIMSLESVFAALGGFLLLHEILTARELIGCAIIFAAVIFVQLPEKQKREKQKKSAAI